MSAMSLRGISLVALLVACVGRTLSSQTPAPAPTTITYTDEQATRGGAVFSSVCLECHARKDMTNEDFRVAWGGRPVFDLFERIRTTMPESGPGSLRRSEYLDVTAYLVQLNGIAASTTPLPDDDAALKTLVLTLRGVIPWVHAPRSARLRPASR